MTKLTEIQVRTLFRAMHQKGSSTYNVANTGRSNTAVPYDGDKFVDKFNELLDEGLEITKGVYEKFDA